MINENQPVMAIKSILSIKEFCDLLSISRQTAYLLEKTGKIVPTRLNGRVYYDADKVKQAIFNPSSK